LGIKKIAGFAPVRPKLFYGSKDPLSEKYIDPLSHCFSKTNVLPQTGQLSIF
jgi:hypothetical protein